MRLADDPEDGRRTVDAYARSTYGMSLEQVTAIQALVTGTADEVATTLGRYIDAGARHLILRIGALTLKDQHDQLERIADILPRLGQ
ncbi:hypothetical protein GCM10025734_35210 [Kitasatospora paranensis]